MATSPKRKPRTSRQQRSYLWFTLIYTLSFVVAAYVIFRQSEEIQFYTTYIEEHGKQDEPNNADKSKLEHRDNVRKSSNDRKVMAISILGERNSGTTWMYE